MKISYQPATDILTVEFHGIEINSKADVWSFSVENATDKAIQRKHDFPAIDRFVSNERLIKEIGKDLFCQNQDRLLSIPRCLLVHFPRENDSSNKRFYLPEPTPWTLTLLALNDNLRELESSIFHPKSLRDNLFNPTQFLDTLSELALARMLKDGGFVIELEKKFWTLGKGSKDVDIAATKNGRDFYIDVLNRGTKGSKFVASRVYAYDFINAANTASSTLVSKIREKYKDKFKAAFDEGWSGPAWIALDVAKNYDENLNVSLQQLMTSDVLDTELQEALRKDCPMLQGVIVYKSDPTVTKAAYLAFIPLLDEPK